MLLHEIETRDMHAPSLQGWGAFGRSAFLLLAGEISVCMLTSEHMDDGEKEVVRLSEEGDTVGEASLTGMHPLFTTKIEFVHVCE